MPSRTYHLQLIIAIAARLGLATKTVTNNPATIFSKLGVTSRTEAALLARDHGLSHPG